MSSAPAISFVEDLQAALAQLKFARCPALLTASLAALLSMSLLSSQTRLSARSARRSDPVSSRPGRTPLRRMSGLSDPFLDRKFVAGSGLGEKIVSPAKPQLALADALRAASSKPSS